MHHPWEFDASDVSQDPESDAAAETTTRIHPTDPFGILDESLDLLYTMSQDVRMQQPDGPQSLPPLTLTPKDRLDALVEQVDRWRREVLGVHRDLLQLRHRLRIGQTNFN